MDREILGLGLFVQTPTGPVCTKKTSVDISLYSPRDSVSKKLVITEPEATIIVLV
jgi:hypothetical protein